MGGAGQLRQCSFHEFIVDACTSLHILDAVFTGRRTATRQDPPDALVNIEVLCFLDISLMNSCCESLCACLTPAPLTAPAARPAPGRRFCRNAAGGSAPAYQAAVCSVFLADPAWTWSWAAGRYPQACRRQRETSAGIRE